MFHRVSFQPSGRDHPDRFLVVPSRDPSKFVSKKAPHHTEARQFIAHGRYPYESVDAMGVAVPLPSRLLDSECRWNQYEFVTAHVGDTLGVERFTQIAPARKIAGSSGYNALLEATVYREARRFSANSKKRDDVEQFESLAIVLHAQVWPGIAGQASKHILSQVPIDNMWQLFRGNESCEYYGCALTKFVDLVLRDDRAEPLREEVLAVWNGIVSRQYDKLSTLETVTSDTVFFPPTVFQ
ncbi:MAG: hypothetical protein KDD60_03230, partial [Bdellovibrionales bacterium]|nr:hypothetical protein [Bdellovibrionales bacterium]